MIELETWADFAFSSLNSFSAAPSSDHLQISPNHITGPSIQRSQRDYHMVFGSFNLWRLQIISRWTR